MRTRCRPALWYNLYRDAWCATSDCMAACHSHNRPYLRDQTLVSRPQKLLLCLKPVLACPKAWELQEGDPFSTAQFLACTPLHACSDPGAERAALYLDVRVAC